MCSCSPPPPSTEKKYETCLIYRQEARLRIVCEKENYFIIIIVLCLLEVEFSLSQSESDNSSTFSVCSNVSDFTMFP